MNAVAVNRWDSTISSVPTVERAVCLHGDSGIPTHFKESSYHPPLSSQSSQTEQEEEKEEEEETLHANYFLTEKSKLESLFRRCQECGSLLDQTSMCWKQVASALTVTYQCIGCKEWFRWDTQPKKGSGKSKVYELNQSLPIASFVTGTPLPVNFQFPNALPVIF